jgi:hypothetical protein
MSSVLQGQWLQGQRLQGKRLQPQRHDADRALAARDARIPALNWVLHDAAFRLFLNSVDPFRNRAGDSPADTDRHIRRALELIA